VPDLGNYATEVLTAYAVSLGLLVSIVGLSLRRSRRIKAALERLENG